MENSHCLNCQNFTESRGDKHFCAAFPKGNGIPQSIWEDKDMHNEHVQGQVGDYVYEPVEESRQRKTG
jgi:hypothetical protein